MKENDVKKVLKGIITTALGNPRGDPDQTHMLIAAIAYKALMHFGFDVSEYSKKGCDTLEYLEGKNIYKCNFLEGVDWKGNYR